MGENYHHYRITKANSNRPISLTTISQRTRWTTAHAGLRGSSREILNVLCVCVFSVLANSTFSSLIIYYFLPLPNGKKYLFPFPPRVCTLFLGHFFSITLNALI